MRVSSWRCFMAWLPETVDAVGADDYMRFVVQETMPMAKGVIERLQAEAQRESIDALLSYVHPLL